MENHAPAPCSKPLSVHVSYGCCYINRRWHHCTIRPVRFRRASIPFHALGALVDRRCSFRSLLLGPGLCHVSVFLIHSNYSNLYASFRISKHEHSREKMTSVWLLPVVTLIVASSVGGELAQALHAHSATCALATIALTTFILSIGLALASMILTIYFARLVLHGFPQGLSIVSSFIPLGPCGQAGFSVLIIGQFMKEKLPVPGSRSPFLDSSQAGEVVFVLCVCISFILWAFATMWLVYALLGIQHILRRTQISFELAFWGMIFPNVSRIDLLSPGLRDF